nr:DCC1-like thiol-disulfide oxidoreductase family protein [Halobacillus locisalis]
MIVYYDSNCPLCISVKEKWVRIDVRRKITFISFREERVRNSVSVPMRELEKEMHSREEGSSVYFRGVDTFIQMTQRVPLLNVLAPLLGISQRVGAAQKVYQYVASNRKVNGKSKCSEGKCKI